MSSAARTTAGAAAMIAAAATAATLTASPAAAADGNTKTTLYTLASNGFCGGKIDVGVGHYPGQATLFLSSTLYGIPSCTVDLTYTFAKRGSDVRKTFVRHIKGPGVWGTSKDIVSPGPAGVYDVTVTTNAPHTAAQPMVLDIQPYRG